MNVVILNRALTIPFAIYRYISIYGSLRTNWMVSGGQECIVDKSCDARECPAMPASALRCLRVP